MIRQAIRRDSAEAIPLICQAIGDLAFILSGTSDVQETVFVLSDFFQQEDNRLSYQNALVMEEEGQLVGLVLLYDGAKARELDLPLESSTARPRRASISSRPPDSRRCRGSLSGIGTFGQFAVGFSTQSPKSGFTSYVEADLRTGSNIQGWGLTAGLRYSY